MAKSLDDYADELSEFKSRVAFILRSVEWSRHIEGTGAPDFDPEWHLCPKCGRDSVHAPDCELAALLRECES